MIPVEISNQTHKAVKLISLYQWQDESELFHPCPVTWVVPHTKMDGPTHVPRKPRSFAGCALEQALPSPEGRTAEGLDIEQMNQTTRSISASTTSPRKPERAFVRHNLIARSCDSSRDAI